MEYDGFSTAGREKHDCVFTAHGPLQSRVLPFPKVIKPEDVFQKRAHDARRGMRRNRDLNLNGVAIARHGRMHECGQMRLPGIFQLAFCRVINEEIPRLSGFDVRHALEGALAAVELAHRSSQLSQIVHCGARNDREVIVLDVVLHETDLGPFSDPLVFHELYKGALDLMGLRYAVHICIDP